MYREGLRIAETAEGTCAIDEADELAMVQNVAGTFEIASDASGVTKQGAFVLFQRRLIHSARSGSSLCRILLLT
jgi:hypothetical protein